MTDTVGALGEAAVLARILPHFRGGSAVTLGPGDDCAVVEFSGASVVTADTMIEGHDFRLDWTQPEELGWKLAMTNLSDVVAMGAVPVALTIALACPDDTEVSLLEGIAQGMQNALDLVAPGCAVAGGDLAHASELVCAVTALGDLRGEAPVKRSGARVGDQVAYAGELGLSTLGLAALFAHGPEAREFAPREVRAQLAPVTPIASGLQAGAFHATAMMDVSDGLSLDAARLGRASGVTIDLDGAALTRHFGVQDGVVVSLRALLHSGEDHGFLATFPKEQPVPPGFCPIGTVRERGEALLVNGEPVQPAGWDPFQNR
ncbi:thiamine-phosphate kinase [Leucobacter sp. UCMA 4100]|uniref:thiamine-phosphate kinase n=1 Tax=Leucobacter sp. UCMA 4100 TaxID=2810534 RepID=UPI0022EB2190|nr:thiamine-phosphate kinase [Leucobacter sp. UCMA 4100]MDA3148003.1 thiamine-phosphate kinase [Leucobacter sp. UCMA 4100]